MRCIPSQHPAAERAHRRYRTSALVFGGRCNDIDQDAEVRHEIARKALLGIGTAQGRPLRRSPDDSVPPSALARLGKEGAGCAAAMVPLVRPNSQWLRSGASRIEASEERLEGTRVGQISIRNLAFHKIPIGCTTGIMPLEKRKRTIGPL